VETAPSPTSRELSGQPFGPNSADGAGDASALEGEWLQTVWADESLGLRVLAGWPRPTVREESSHSEIEIAIPGAASIARVEHHSASGRNAVSEVRGHHVSIIPNGQPHRVEWRATAELVVIFLAPALVEQAASELSGAGLLHVHESYTAIDPVIRQLGLGIQRTPPDAIAAGRALYVTSLAHVLAMHLVQHYGTGRPCAEVGARLSNHALRRATEFMLSNLAVSISLEDVARAAGLSRFHFAHMFKNTTGMGPHRYLTLARVERAKELLRGTEMELSALAQFLGFSDQSHMSSVFKRFTGSTPKTYRQAL